jgi:hypothetical protein
MVEVTDTTKSKRPIGLLLYCGYFAACIALGLFLISLRVITKGDPNEGLAATMAYADVASHVFSPSVLLLKVGATYAMMRYRKSAVNWLKAILIVGILIFFYQLSTVSVTMLSYYSGNSGISLLLVREVVGWAVASFAILYCGQLVEKGVLR